MKTKKCIYIN